MKPILLLTSILMLSACSIMAQSISQTIKGQIVDRESEIPLPGATVVVIDSDPLIGTASDFDGYFRLENVPIGRVSLTISYLGYETAYIRDLLIGSGKEIVLTISLTESFSKLSEVTVSAKNRKETASNDMATLSARSFSVEETQRYAGGMDDPSRLASSMAGVTPSTIDNNEIVIRGNAAKGILWRVNELEIPAPNHLAGLFSGGGVNMMFSTTMLANSDFLTGAFPAEYGNAISGVFDLKLRTGNQDKRETSLQFGSYGLEAATEGPFKKGNRASYLVDYRYSTYGLLEALLPDVTGLPVTQDVSFKLNLPTKKAGIFSVWSINGMGRIDFEPSNTPEEWETNYENMQYDINYNLTASGLRHKMVFGNSSYILTTAGFSATEYTYHSKYYRKEDLSKAPYIDQNEINTSLSLNSYLNHKFSSRLKMRSGFSLKQLGYSMDVESNTDVALSNDMDFFVKSTGSTQLVQAYGQIKYLITEKLALSAGLQAYYFGLNSDASAEPRIGLKWNWNGANAVGLSYGKHSRLEPLRIYLMETDEDSENSRLLNKNLPLTKAHHFVAAFEHRMGSSAHLKIEPYVQLLFDVPVMPDSSFSMINYKNDMYFTSKLTGEGTGTNVGIDLTLEQFMNRGFYYLLTASVYDSNYKGGDGIEHSTRYNQNYVANLLMGKEWQTKKSNTFSINGKFSVIGGIRHSPINETASKEQQFVVYDDSKIYEEQTATNFYLDMSANYRINRQNHSHAIILQVKNLLMQKEFLGHAYNYASQKAEAYELRIVYPYVSYKFEF